MALNRFTNAVVLFALILVEALLLWPFFWRPRLDAPLPGDHVFFLIVSGLALIPLAAWRVWANLRNPAGRLSWWRAVAAAVVLAVSGIAGSVWVEVYTYLPLEASGGPVFDPATTWAIVLITVLGPFTTAFITRPSRSMCHPTKEDADAGRSEP